MAARMFQLMKYSNKDFLSPWVFESTLGGSLVPSPFALSGQASIFYKCFELGHVKGRNFCRNFWCAVVKPEGVIRNYAPQASCRLKSNIYHIENGF